MLVPLLMAAIAGPPPEPQTAAAVIRADTSWQFAESHGNAGFLDHLLLPCYVSVAADGSVTTKAMLVAKAGKRQPSQLRELQDRVAEWRRKHPTQPTVLINGDTAILQWITSDKRQLVSSVDVFTYVGGQWRAVYSQHTSAFD
jgi:hypothetical protein